MFLQTAQHTHSSQSVVMTAVVSANTDGAASALQCRLCSFVSGLVTKNGSELTPSSLTSQHFMTFSQFYIISDRSVEVAPSRISSIHSTGQTPHRHRPRERLPDSENCPREHISDKEIFPQHQALLLRQGLLRGGEIIEFHFGTQLFHKCRRLQQRHHSNSDHRCINC